MPTIPPGFVEVSINYTNKAQHQCHAVFGASVSRPLAQIDVDGLSLSFSTPMSSLLSSASNYQGISVLEGQDGPPLKWTSIAGAILGTKGGTMMAPQVQVLVKKTTNLASRQGAGRTYFPDVLEADVSDTGGVNPSAITIVQTAANAIKNALGAPPFGGMFLLHSTGGRLPDRVQSYTCETIVATQRRRLPGR